MRADSYRMCRSWAMVALVSAMAGSTACWAQVGNTGGGGLGTGLSLGNGAQGSRLGSQANFAAGNRNSAIALSSRFQSDSSRFQAGSQALGQTTAGMGAVNGVFGGGNGGFGGLTGGLGGRGGFQNLMNLGMMSSFGRGGFGMNQRGMNQQMNQQGQRQVRARLVVGFNSPTGSTGAETRRVSLRLQTRLTRAMPRRAAGVEVVLDGSTAVLRGRVASDHDRRVIELLVKMEPGVADVRNELRAESTESPPSSG